MVSILLALLFSLFHNAGPHRSSGLLSERTSVRVQTRDTSVQDEISRLVLGRDHGQRFSHSRVTASLEVATELR